MAEVAKLELVESNENYNVPALIELSSEMTTTLGRSSKQCTIVLDATPTKSISRKHAEIACKKGKRGCDTYILRDLGSTNGVFVNEIKIQEKALEHGDVVQFGGAADIPVGTRFGGTGSHIRYRFDHRAASPPPVQESRKRKQSPETTTDESAAQRPKIERANTQDAADALRAIGNSSWAAVKTGEEKGLEGAPTALGAGGEEAAAAAGSSAENAGGAGGAVGDGGGGGGETPTMVAEVLRDAMCGLCSELLLDAGVLPCSHSFCRVCWADHVAEKGTTCPVCMRKMHSSERNPRQCSNLDLLITSIVHKLAGPKERERWTARQHQAQKRAAAQTHLVSSNGSSNGTATEAARKAAAAVSNPIPARGVHFAEKGAGSGLPNENNARGAQGESGRSDSASRRYSSSGVGVGVGVGGSGSGRGGRGAVAAAAAAAEVVEKCQGCNEEGHEFGECPHRSDSALEGSDDDDDDDEEEEEEEEEEYSDDA